MAINPVTEALSLFTEKIEERGLVIRDISSECGIRQRYAYSNQ